MKTVLMLLVLASGVFSTSMHATTKQGYQQATVVRVESHETSSNYAGSNPSDAPLQSVVYSYEIGIRQGCTMYRTRYDSAFDYVPAVFDLNHPIQVNVKRRVIHVNLPGDRELRMGIDSRRRIDDQSCPGRN